MKTIEIKHMVGDEVYFLRQNLVYKGEVEDVKVTNGYSRDSSNVSYKDVSNIQRRDNLFHDECFETKADLLASL